MAAVVFANKIGTRTPKGDRVQDTPKNVQMQKPRREQRREANSLQRVMPKK